MMPPIILLARRIPKLVVVVVVMMLVATGIPWASGLSFGTRAPSRPPLPRFASPTITPTTATTTTKPPLQGHPRLYEHWNWRRTNNKGGASSFRIHYRATGPKSGRPLLLTHGFGANLHHFRHQYDALAEAGYRVYAVDLIGFGASAKASPADVPYSIELFAQQLKDFMSTRPPGDHNGEGWILAGNSMGSLCSLAVTAELSSQQQQKKKKKNNSNRSSTGTQTPVDSNAVVEVAALVLFNSAGGMTGFRYSDVPIWAHPIMGHFQYFLLNPKLHGPFIFNTLVRRSVIEAVLTRGGIYQNTDNVDEALLEILLRPASDVGAKDVFLAVYGGPPGPTREELLRSIPPSIPIYCLWGADDPFTPLDEASEAALREAAHHNFSFEFVPNAGHCLHDEYPEIVNAKVLDFLRARGLHGAAGSAIRE